MENRLVEEENDVPQRAALLCRSRELQTKKYLLKNWNELNSEAVARHVVTLDFLLRERREISHGASVLRKFAITLFCML